MTIPVFPPSELTVLVLGKGGREHALVRSIAADPAVIAVHVAPGNPGTAAIATNHPDVDMMDPAAVVALARQIDANLVVVGPEAPLAAGVSDALREADIAVFGPSKAAAQLESSKAFAKQVMHDAGVPTGRSHVCQTPGEVAAALDDFGAPYVVKFDGLAAGKGVLVTTDRDAAIAHAAGADRVVIEEYLDGPEVSLFVITDGKTALPMLPAQDFKRVGDGDEGPNTGGMGAYTPLEWLPPKTLGKVMAQVVYPTLEQMEKQLTPFSGLLYVGLAITKAGPRVIEFNARFGDPETEPLLALLETPLAQVLFAAAVGRLADIPTLAFAEAAAVGVVMASDGYPGDYQSGVTLGLPADTEDAHILHAGTDFNEAGDVVSAGGRVLVVVGRGVDVPAARDAAYAHLAKVDFDGGFWRTDIANEQKLAGEGTRIEAQKPGKRS